MQVLLIPNLQKEGADQCIRQTAEVLLCSGCAIYMDSELQRQFGDLKAQFGPMEKLLRSCSHIFSIGGDGTILHAAILAAQHDKPLLGINMGRLGFLAQLECTQPKQLEQVIRGDYFIEERMLLTVEVYKDGVLYSNHYGLNDVVVTRTQPGKMVDLNVECDGRHFTNYRADGVILATPTGSTAYSLSAGGSIVDPAIESLIMTPICPHSLFDRSSIVLSPHKTLTVRSRELNSPSDISIAVDGTVVEELCHTDHIRVAKADITAKFIRLPNADFYKILTKKMMVRES